MGLLIKRVTGSAASKGQVWLRAGGVCLYMSVDWKERAECVCVCVCVCDTQNQTFTAQQKKKR